MPPLRAKIVFQTAGDFNTSCDTNPTDVTLTWNASCLSCSSLENNQNKKINQIKTTSFVQIYKKNNFSIKWNVFYSVIFSFCSIVYYFWSNVIKGVTCLLSHTLIKANTILMEKRDFSIVSVYFILFQLGLLSKKCNWTSETLLIPLPRLWSGSTSNFHKLLTSINKKNVLNYFQLIPAICLVKWKNKKCATI